MGLGLKYGGQNHGRGTGPSCGSVDPGNKGTCMQVTNNNEDTSISSCQKSGQKQRLWSPKIPSWSSSSFLPIASPSSVRRQCCSQETGKNGEAGRWKRGRPGGVRWRKPSAQVKAWRRQGQRPLAPSAPHGVAQVRLAAVSLFPEPDTLPAED